MDGKKRIARLRNAEKWKKLGLKGFGFFKDQKKEDEILAKVVDCIPIPQIGKAKRRHRVHGEARTDGLVWDEWSYSWRKADPPGVFGNAKRMIEALQKKGFKKLGAGHYSTVLAHPSCTDKVIKVTRQQDNWIDYVKWASEKGYAGGFAPKVYSWKKFPSGWSWAVMERMECTVKDSGDCFGCYGSSSESPSAKSKGSDFSLIFSLMYPAERGNILAQLYIEDLCPGAFGFIKDLRSTMRASDIRGPNTMVRSDGTLCFTDPCAGETKLTTTRLRSGDFSPSIWRYFIEGFNRYRSK